MHVACNAIGYRNWVWSCEPLRIFSANGARDLNGEIISSSNGMTILPNDRWLIYRVTFIVSSIQLPRSRRANSMMKRSKVFNAVEIHFLKLFKLTHSHLKRDISACLCEPSPSCVFIWRIAATAQPHVINIIIQNKYIVLLLSRKHDIPLVINGD